MIQQLEGLNQEEQQLMIDAVPLVTILIAGADGEIDSQELSWSKKLTEIRSYSHTDPQLDAYYTLIGEHFEPRVQALIAESPQDTAARQALISEKLAGLNAILPKLEFNFANRLHKSLTSFAEHVAKASGGFLGIGSISPEEAELLSLPMIKPLAV